MTGYELVDVLSSLPKESLGLRIVLQHQGDGFGNHLLDIAGVEVVNYFPDGKVLGLIES